MKMIGNGLIVAAALAFGGAAGAEDYTVEGGVSWWNFDGDGAWGSDVTAYFSPVRVGTYPRAEAPFLNQTGNLRIDYTRDDNGDYDLTEGMLEVYANNYYAALSASRFSNGSDLDSVGVQLGRMVTPATRLTLGWEQVEVDEFDEIDIFTLGAKHVTMFGGGRALNLETSLGVADNGGTDFVYDTLVDYYLTPDFSFGARYRGIGSDDQYGLATRYFFLPNWSGEVEWLREDGLDRGRDDIIQLRLGARF